MKGLKLRSLWVLLLVLLASLVIDCSGEGNPLHLEKQDLTRDPIMVEPLYRFMASLFQSMKKADENLIFSPLSVHFALNMLALGVRDGSQTEADLVKALGYTNISFFQAQVHETNRRYKDLLKSITAEGVNKKAYDKPTVLDMMNVAIVKSCSIREEYLNDVERYYEAIVREIQNESDQQKVLEDVNKWGKEAGFSGDILEKTALEEAVLVLVNAVRVEAFWFEAFSETKLDKLFYNHGRPDGLIRHATGLATYSSDIKFVEFTRKRNGTRNPDSNSMKHYNELAGLEFRAIDIGLSDGLSYTILEPLSTTSGAELAKLEAALMDSDFKDNLTRMSKVMAILDTSNKVTANVEMPGFKLEKRIDLDRHLGSIGLDRLFGFWTADLDKMSAEKLKVEGAYHKAMIDVNKNGIKAAAVTVIPIVPVSSGYEPFPKIINVHVKNPYLYLIRHNKVPLFAGHLVHVE